VGIDLRKELKRTNQAIRHQYAAHDRSAPIIKVNHLSVIYGTGLALDDLSFELPRAISLAVVGPNGAGKSTLIKVIAGLIPASEGEVTVFGVEPGVHICIAYVPQRSQVDWQFPVTVRDVVLMGRIGKLGLLKRAGQKDQEVVDRALSVVNLAEQAKRQISELSGGQQQRMFIARALAQEAELMLMDEPLTGLDVGSQEDILNIIDVLRGQGVTTLVALHDLKLAAERFDAAILLNHHLIGVGTPQNVFTNENLVQAYGLNRVANRTEWMPVDDTCCGDDHDHD
jgi:manganese/iron transport system ATP-binding protein